MWPCSAFIALSTGEHVALDQCKKEKKAVLLPNARAESSGPASFLDAYPKRSHEGLET